MIAPQGHRPPSAYKRFFWFITRIHTDALLWVVIVCAVLVAASFSRFTAHPISFGIGSLGDRLFLTRTTSIGNATDGHWFSDELTPGSSTGRARWSQQMSQLNLPVSKIRTITLEIAGWPTESQPNVSVLLDNQSIGEFVPTKKFATYQFDVSAEDSHGSLLTLRTDGVLTETLGYADPRQKGIRLGSVLLSPTDTNPLEFAYAPVMLWYATVMFLLMLLLGYCSFSNVTRGILLGAGLVGSFVFFSTVGYWIVPIAPALAQGTVVFAVVLRYSQWLPIVSRLFHRFRTNKFVAMLSGWVILVAILCAGWFATDSALWHGWTIALILVILLEKLLPRYAIAVPLDQILRSVVLMRWSVFIALAILVLWVIQQTTFIGHADYADNAVVARNIARGRGWVVDYVTQFYQIYPTVTHPQETWPLLQPVWIALSFMVFGVNDFGARMPNVVFWGLLVWLIDRYARFRWGGKVAIVSVVLATINIYLYRQVVYATSDIAFVVFATAALQSAWLLPQSGETYWTNGWFRGTTAKVIATGCWTGLMLLQKPGSAAMLAFGIGIWLLWTFLHPLIRSRQRFILVAPKIGLIALWAVISLVILTPYLLYNLVHYGTPVHSTESFDAWILEYTHWDAIYRIYAADGGIGTGDLPDRSWLLRWGFDALLQKVWIQWSVIQDYLTPSLAALPSPLNEYGAAAAASGLLSPLALWAMPIGLWRGLIGWRPRPWGILAVATLPYGLFMVLYWHANEPRYWMFLLPWMALAAARGIVWVVDCASLRFRSPGYASRLVLISGALLASISPSFQSISVAQPLDAARVLADRDMYAYIHQSTPVTAVIMTRVPWQLQWYGDRGAVMIPADADAKQILRIAKHYKARYLALDSLQRPNATTRAVIGAMIAAPGSGFRLVYRTPAYPVKDSGRAFTMVSELYAFPADYQGVPAIR